MQRREFIKFCAASAAATGSAGVAADAAPTFYHRAQLVDAGGAPLKASRLPVDRNLIFLYPFASTPCFLLNLGRPAKASAHLATADKRSYEWTGGVGPQHSVVAYSAICAHQLAYPTREISFISYRTEKSARNRFDHVIHCCSEHSQYDPAEGARVLAGPAPQPLAAILLDYDAASDGLTAVGTLGGEMFNQFFAKYERKLALEGAKARTPSAAACKVVELENYCRQQVKC
jgi:arsenite oxidase small subunit